MIRRVAIATLAWMLLSAFSEPLPEGFSKGSTDGSVIVHNASGFFFPAYLLGFNSGNKLLHSFDGSAATDVSVGYNYYAPMRNKSGSPDITATIYIYPPRSTEVFDTTVASVNAENAIALSEINTAHKNTLRDVVSDPVKGKCGKKDILGAHNTFNVDFTNASGKRMTLPGEVYLFRQGEWLVKFRFTSEHSITGTTLEFVKSFFEANQNHITCT